MMFLTNYSFIGLLRFLAEYAADQSALWSMTIFLLADIVILIALLPCTSAFMYGIGLTCLVVLLFFTPSASD